MTKTPDEKTVRHLKLIQGELHEEGSLANKIRAVVESLNEKLEAARELGVEVYLGQGSEMVNVAHKGDFIVGCAKRVDL